MSRYDNYVKVMNKINRIRTFTIKYKVPLLAAVIVSSASLCGFLLTKGMIISTSEIPSVIYYGEEYKLENAKVLFGKASYEYREKDSSSWSKELPTSPGEYYVRAVSNRAFGVKSYSDEKLVEIKPINVFLDIENTSLVYGDIPTFDSSFLVRNDRIEKVNVSFENPQSSNTIVDITSMVIKNEDGKDVSSFYSFECEGKMVDLLPKTIDFIPLLESKVYDGEEIFYEDGKLTKEVQFYDDEVSFDVYYTDSVGNRLDENSVPVNAGDYYIFVDLDTFTATNNGINVNNKYNINKSSAGFSIFQREIKIETKSDSKTYDGKSFVQSNSDNIAFISNDSPYSLIDGDQIVINGDDFNYQNEVNADVYINQLSISIVNKYGENNSSNYKIISYDYGKLEIQEKIINGTLTPIESTFEYDGESITNSSFDYTNVLEISNEYLVEGQKIEFGLKFIDLSTQNVIDKPKNAGKYRALIDYIYVSDENNANYTNNYINQINGFDFEITPRKVKIQPLSIDSFVYDGINHSYSSAVNNFIVLESSVIGTDFFSIKVLFENIDRKDISIGGNYCSAGQYKYYIDEVVAYGNTNLSNYNFDFGDNEFIFEIYKKEFSITLFDIGEIEYTGKEYQYNVNAYNHEFVNDEFASLILKYYKNDGIKYIESTPLNIGEYKVSVVGLNYGSNTDGKNYNININSAYKDFVINKRKVTLSLSSFDVTYGETVSYNKKGYEVISGSFADNQSVELDISIDGDDSKLDVGNYQLNCFNVEYLNKNIIDETIGQNYDITIDNSNSFLYITKRSISIEPKKIDSFVYDGIEYSYSDFVNSSFGNFDYADSSLKLVGNENIKIEVNFINNSTYSVSDSIKNAGSYEVTIYNVIPSSGTNLDNYEINILSYTLNINRRIIKIAPIDVESKVYDNVYVSFGLTDYTIIIEDSNDYDIVNGDKLEVDILIYDENLNYRSQVKDAGTYYAEITYFYVNDNIEDKNNYFLETYTSRFEIYKRDVTLKYCDDQKTYDGEDYIFNDSNYEVVNGNFAEVGGGVLIIPICYYSYEDTLTSLGSIKNAGSYYPIAEPYEGINGVDLNNYNILFDTSTVIEIKKRSVTIQTLDIEDFEYDGQEHYYPSYYGNYDVVSETKMVGDESFILPICFNYENEIQTYALNAGYYYMVMYSMLDTTINGINNFLVSNYEFTFILGDFTINKRHVEVKIEDITKVYDGIIYNHTYNIETINNTSFPNDEGIIAKNVSFSATPLDVGTYDMKIDSFIFNDNTLEKNYDIDYSALGTLEITKRHIILNPSKFDNKEYDGLYYEYDNSSAGNYTVISSTSIVEGEAFIVSAYFVSASDGKQYSKVKDAGTYTLLIDLNTIKSGNDNTKLSNYEITSIGLSFTINQLSLDILPDLSLIIGNSYYDGNEKEYEQKLNNFIITNNKTIPDGEGFIGTLGISNIDGFVSLLHASNYDIYIDINKLTMYDETKLSNYLFTSYSTNYTIETRKLTIDLLEMEETIYDGQAHSYANGVENNFTLLNGSMVGDEILSIYCNVGDNTSVYDVGIYGVNYIYHEVIGGLASDYEVTQQRVLIYNIIKRYVSISLYQIDDFTYQGKEVEPYKLGEPNQFNYEEGSLELVDGEYIYFKQIEYYSSTLNKLIKPFDAGVYNYTAYVSDDYLTFVGRSLDNYSIIFDTKSFTINKAELNVTILEEDIIHTYNNEEVTDIYGFTSNILGNDTISIDVKVLNENEEEEAPINAKTYYVYIDQVFVSCPSNYNIIISNSYRRIIINPCDVYVSTVNKIVTYNGEKVDLLSENLEVGPSNGSVLYNDDVIIITEFIYYSDSEGTTIIENPKDAATYYFGIKEVTINNIDHITNYNFIFDEEIYSLVINPKQVTIYALQMETIDYDGESHSYPTYMGNYDSAKGALPGVEFNISIVFRHYGYKNNNSDGVFADEFEDVRSTSVSRAYFYLYDDIIVNECSGDLISNYTYVLGSDNNLRENSFTINQLYITVYTGGESSVYDGEYHLFDGNISSSTELLAGHELFISQSIVKQDYMFKDVGVYTNRFPVDIIDKNNLDNEYNGLVTENYKIHYVFGTIEIKPKELSIVSLDMSKTYDGLLDDGKELTIDTDFNMDGLVLSDDIVVVTNYLANQQNSSDYIEVGEYTNFVVVSSIVDQYGDDVLNNYLITYLYGKYVITVIDIGIEFNDITCDFNNAIFDYSFTNESVYGFTDENRLQNNDQLHATFTYYLNGDEVDEIKMAGIYTVIISDITILDSVTFDDRTNSYQIICDSFEAEVIIEKIEVDIQTNSHTWVYDENVHYDYTATFIDPSKITFECEIVCVGEYESVLDIGEEKINKFDFVIMAGEDDISSCFIINDINYGTIKIGDELSISDVINSFQYDGYIHSETEFDLNCTVNYMNASNLTCVINVEFKDNKIPYNAGEYYCRITSYTILYKNKSGNIIDQTSAYNFIDFASEENNNYEKYKVEVEKRVVYIGLLNTTKSKVYDGEILSFASNEWTYITDELNIVRQDRLAIPDTLYITVGIVNSSGVVQPDNANAGTKTYQIIDYNIFGLNGLELDLNPTASLKEKYLSYDIIVRKEDDIEYDKSIHFYTCRGSITKRVINIKTYGSTEPIIYDGQTHYFNQWEMEENGEDEGLLPNHTISLIENGYGVVNVGSYLNRLKFNITDSLGNNYNTNYSINYNTWDEGYIDIDYRHITIEIGSKTITESQLINEYGGVLVCYDYVILEGELVEGQTLFTEELYDLFTDDEKYKYRNSIVRFITGSLSEVGTVKNTFDDYYLYAYFLSDDGKLTSKRSRNYEFTIICGTLTVVQDDVAI